MVDANAGKTLCLIPAELRPDRAHDRIPHVSSSFHGGVARAANLHLGAQEQVVQPHYLNENKYLASIAQALSARDDATKRGAD